MKRGVELVGGKVGNFSFLKGGDARRGGGTELSQEGRWEVGRDGRGEREFAYMEVSWGRLGRGPRMQRRRRRTPAPCRRKDWKSTKISTSQEVKEEQKRGSVIESGKQGQEAPFLHDKQREGILCSARGGGEGVL